MSIPNNASKGWLHEYMPRLADAIKRMSLTVNLLPFVFPYEGLYKNLTSMVLKRDHAFTVEFKIEEAGAYAIAMECLNVLSQCDRNSYFHNQAIDLKKDEQVD